MANTKSKSRRQRDRQRLNADNYTPCWEADDPVSDLVVKSLEPSKSPANPPSDPKRKANT